MKHACMQCRTLFLSCIILFVLISFPLIDSVEASWVMWSQTYGGKYGDIAQSLVETSDGGYALAGTTISSNDRSSDFWLVKTDMYGNMEWNQTYGGGNGDSAYSLVETSDGGFALAGLTDSFDAGYDFWFVKTDMYGNMEWNQTYGGTSDDRAHSLVETSDGGYALAGYTNSFGAGGFDFWLVKTDAYGNTMWSRTYGGADIDIAYSLVETSDGGYALAGLTDSFDAGDDDFWLVKTDMYGNMEWNQTYGGAAANSLVETSDGGYALAGSSDFIIHGFWLVKTDMYGNMEWNQTYGGTDYEYAYSLVETSDGGYALAGNKLYSDGTDDDFWLVKTDMYGNMEWNQTYGGTDIDFAHSLVETSDGGFALAGYTMSFGAGSTDFWLVKTYEKGVISIVSPENKTYFVNNVSLTFTVSKPASWMGYSLDGQDNVTINGNTTLTGLSLGKHNLIVYARDFAGNSGSSETIYFTMAQKEPFPTTLIAATTVIVAIAVVGVAILVYFRRIERKKRELSDLHP